MIQTQDPLPTAKRLQRRAAENGKPLRVFLGVGRNRMLAAVDDKSDLRQRMPIREITVTHGALQPETLAATLTAVWAAINAEIRDLALNPSESHSVPDDAHFWRGHRDAFGRRRGAAR